MLGLLSLSHVSYRPLPPFPIRAPILNQKPLPGCLTPPLAGSVTLGQSHLPRSHCPHLSNRVDTSPDSSGPLPGPALECQVALSAPDAEDLLRVLLTVGRGGNDEQSVQQIDGDAVGTLVAGAPDPREQGEGKAVRVMPPERGSPVFLLGTPRPPASTTAPTHWAKYHLTFSSVGVTPDCAAVPKLRQSCCRAWLVLAG